MSQNSEQIEAKLCAYLEGELDAQGRAEIEKHLEANPAHRKLLAEVGQTRGMLRALPREPAPPDICEAFQGQLERSVLLANFDDQAEGTALRINRWPQYFAVAAVVMLAAGLGMVVYFGLPSTIPQPAPYAIGGGGGGGSGGSSTRQEDRVVPESTARVTVPATTGPHTLNEGLARGGAVSATGESRFNEFADGGDRMEPIPSTAPAGNSPDLVALAARVRRSWDPAEGGQLFSRAASPDVTRAALAELTPKTQFYLVTAARPQATSEEIGKELSRLQVAWSVLPAPDADTVRQELATRTMAFGTYYRQNRGAALADQVRADADVKLRSDAEQQLKKDENGAGAAPPPPAPAQMPAPARPAAPAALDAVEPSAEPAPRSEAVATRGPSTRPSQPADAAGVADQPAVATTGNLEFLTTEPANETEAGKALARKPATLIIARNLTLEQCEALGIALTERQSARVLKAAEDPAARESYAVAAVPEVMQQKKVELKQQVEEQDVAAEPAAGDAVIQKGDLLRLEVAAAGGEATVTDIQVGPDGTAAIPGVERLQCAGLTVDQLGKRLADDLRQTVQAERVAVTRLGDEYKAKREAEKEAVARSDAATAPATETAALPKGGVGPEVAMRDANDRGAVRARMARTSSPAPAATQSPAAAGAEAPPPAPGAAAQPHVGRAAQDGQQEQQVRQGMEVAAGVAGAPAREARAARLQPAQQPAKAATTAAVASADDRFDVVIVVDEAGAVAGVPVETGETEAAGPIEKFDILTVQVGDAEADAANVRVGEDGTVELPDLGRVQAEGRTAEQLREDIALKLKQTAGAAERNVVVRRLGGNDTAAAPQDKEAGKAEPPAVQPAPGEPR